MIAPAPRRARFALALWSLALLRCSPPSPPPPADASAPDVTAPVDATVSPPDATVPPPDTTPTDAAISPADASPTDAAISPTDASLPRDGGPANDTILGTLFGACPSLGPSLGSSAPSLVRNELRFMSPERYERAALSPGGQRIFDTPNAGGSSIESEVMAYEVLHHCEGASLAATETEVRYQPPDDGGPNTITDLVVTLGGRRIGVSVTRVYRPAPMMLSDADVRAQLVTKLQGINRSSVRVLPSDRWVKQILSVFVANPTVAAQIERVWPTIDAPTRADTIVLVTATQGGGFIYCNPDPPLGAECPSL